VKGGANKLPPEVHAMHGSKGMNAGIMIPDKIKKRIPFAEWVSNPAGFSKQRFVEETAQYLFEVYGIGTDQDRHTLAMLADQMQTYITARLEQDQQPLVISINDGKTMCANPYIGIANKAMENCVKLMNELGLTPKSRLAANKLEDASPLADFLKGWQPQ
jgi:P27 family predicted phage terminase small subunit